jgi:probable lipoprotein (TIGR04455 family)
MRRPRILSIIGLLVLLSALACSSVYNNRTLTGYRKGADMVKRIHITTRPVAGVKRLGPLSSAIATDVVRTNRNYLVYSAGSSSLEIEKLCDKNRGVLEFQIDSVERKGEKVAMTVTGRLFRCMDKKVVWEASARRREKIGDPSLENLAKIYGQVYGDTARIYSAPLFNIIEDLVSVMPNPDLSEEEIMEKIELEASGR